MMVLPLISVLGTDRQKKEYLSKLLSFQWIGAYAQTELAHGSDVQNLQTEAILDMNSDEFVIHSPNVGSYKFWPGELGTLGNMALVYCKTKAKGKTLGVFPILVELRDLVTHKLKKGIEMGDIGPKLGYFAKENGFIKFEYVRVPRKNLLSRFFSISKKGDLKIKGNPKIIYSAMMNVRINLLQCSSFDIGKALAIAIRYSCMRK